VTRCPPRTRSSRSGTRSATCPTRPRSRQRWRSTGALRPGGVLAIDILDLDFGRVRAGDPPFARVEDDWAIITEFATPAPDRFVRDITTFVPDGAGAWRRGEEHHENVLIDTSRIPALLAGHGVRASVGTSFGAAELPAGLRSVTGRKY